MYLVTVINIHLFVTVVNVMAEWLVVSCNTHLHLGDPSSPKRSLFSLAAQLYPQLHLISIHRALMDIWANQCALSLLSSTIGPYAQPLNLKGGQLSGLMLLQAPCHTIEPSLWASTAKICVAYSLHTSNLGLVVAVVSLYAFSHRNGTFHLDTLTTTLFYSYGEMCTQEVISNFCCKRNEPTGWFKWHRLVFRDRTCSSDRLRMIS